MTKMRIRSPNLLLWLKFCMATNRKRLGRRSVLSSLRKHRRQQIRWKIFSLSKGGGVTDLIAGYCTNHCAEFVLFCAFSFLMTKTALNFSTPFRFLPQQNKTIEMIGSLKEPRVRTNGSIRGFWSLSSESKLKHVKTFYLHRSPLATIDRGKPPNERDPTVLPTKP